jgi:nucleotide-binding universal stress UspA family protein
VEPDETPPIGSPVLVPFDGSECAEAALPYVPLLVNGHEEVVLLQVIPRAEAISGPLGEILVSADDLQQASLAAARADLERGAARLRQLAPDLRIESIVEIGDPAEQVIATARQHGVRAIVLSSQGHSAARPGGFGSVVSRIVRTAPVPVVVARPGGPTGSVPTISRLVVAHDGSDSATGALPIAQHLARRRAAGVHIVTVVEDEQSPLPAAVAAKLDAHLIEEAQADALNVARQRVEAIGASLMRRGFHTSWQVLAGPAAATIIDTCGPSDVLVITSHGSGHSRWALGSIAEKLVRESPLPVILVRSAPLTPGQTA